MLYVALVLVVLALIFAAASLKIVPQGYVKVIERLGKFHSLAYGGLNVIIPFIDGVRVTIDVREQISPVEPQPAITRDNVTMEVDCVVYWSVFDSVKATYEIQDVRRGLEQLALSALRNVIGELDLDHTLTSRDLINNKMRAVLDESTERWGVKVLRVELKNIEPPPEIKFTMEKQMTAERTRRAVVTEAEGAKAAAILRAEGDKQSNVIAAEGRRAAQILDAEGKAEAIERLAAAEAKLVSTIVAAIGKEADPAGYLVAMKYLDSFKEIARGADKTVFIPYEATAAMGSLGTIKEMLGAHGPNFPPPPGPVARRV